MSILIFNVKENKVYCSKCKGTCISKAAKVMKEMGHFDAQEFIEEEDYEWFICQSCGYADYIDEEI